MNIILDILEKFFYIVRLVIFNLYMYIVMAILVLLPPSIAAMLIMNTQNIVIQYAIIIMVVIFFVIVPIAILFLSFRNNNNISKFDIFKYPKILLKNIERDHAHWIARKYMQPQVRIGQYTLLNQNITVELLGEIVYCKNNKSGEIIMTRLKKFFQEGSKREFWSYTDVWNQICKDFNNNTTITYVIALFDANNNARSYNSFMNVYKIIKNRREPVNDTCLCEVIENYINRFSKVEESEINDERQIDY